MADSQPDSRFKFVGTIGIELALSWSSDEPRNLHNAEELLASALGHSVSVIRGRINAVVAPPGNIVIRGQLIDVEEKASIRIRRDIHAPTKAAIACGNEGLCGPGDEHRPDGRSAGHGSGASERHVSSPGHA